MHNHPLCELKREFLELAEHCRSQIKDWSSATNQPHDLKLQKVFDYTNMTFEYENAAAKAPIKIIRIYEDGREEVRE